MSDIHGNSVLWGYSGVLRYTKVCVGDSDGIRVLGLHTVGFLGCCSSVKSLMQGCTNVF